MCTYFYVFAYVYVVLCTCVFRLLYSISIYLAYVDVFFWFHLKLNTPRPPQPIIAAIFSISLAAIRDGLVGLENCVFRVFLCWGLYWLLFYFCSFYHLKVSILLRFAGTCMEIVV